MNKEGDFLFLRDYDGWISIDKVFDAWWNFEIDDYLYHQAILAVGRQLMSCLPHERIIQATTPKKKKK